MHTNRLRNRIGIRTTNTTNNENVTTGYCTSGEFISLSCINNTSMSYSPIVIIIVLRIALHGVINGVRYKRKYKINR